MSQALLPLLRDLSLAHGVPGHEGAVRSIFTRELAGFDLSSDRLGGVAARQRAGAGPVVALAGHMDEVGFLVHGISADGFISVVPVGGWWTHTLLSQRVRILTRSGREVPGVFGATPPHFLSEDARGKILPLDSLTLDVGARDRAEVTDTLGIQPGDPVAPDVPFTELPVAGRVMGKAFDNRAGMAVVIQAMRELHAGPRPPPCDVVAVGTVQEEVGTRGARTMGAHLTPDVFLILEAPPADDTPGAVKGEFQGRLGGGVQIRLFDPTAVMNPSLANFALDIARAERIPHQVAVRRSGGTDASSFQFAGEGVPCVVLGVPVRYIHAHNGILDLGDLRAALDLVRAMVAHLDSATVAGFTRFLP